MSQLEWNFERWTAPAEELFAQPIIKERQVLLYEWTEARRGEAEPGSRLDRQTNDGVLVLGSTQSESIVDEDALAARNISLVKRRSGGGAVLLEPGAQIWVEVNLPRHDPLWHDQVDQSSLWLGRIWQQALVESGYDCRTYDGVYEPGEWGRLACYASVAPGEVMAGRGKCVGISQRRTKAGARFQCSLIRQHSADEFAALFNLSDSERQALAAELEATVTVIPTGAAAEPDDLFQNFLTALAEV